MATLTPLSKRARLLWIFAGSALYVLLTAAVAFVSLQVGKGPSAAPVIGAATLASTLILALFMSRLISGWRARYVGLVSVVGAFPLAVSLLFPGWGDAREMALSMSWLFLWLPVYIPTAQSRSRGACGVPRAASAAYWFFLTGPLLGGIFLLATAVL